MTLGSEVPNQRNVVWSTAGKEMISVKLLTEDRIAQIEMPENLAVAMMVGQARMACQAKGCGFGS